MRNNVKKGQITLFVILAIVIVGVIVGYFLLKDRIRVSSMPARFQPIENYFLECIQDRTEIGKQILGTQGGWIYLQDFEPGNNYAPFSNQLGFQGASVPYWQYVSSSSYIQEQVPSRQDMERQLETYIEENFRCDFSDFENEGYYVDYSELEVKVSINDLDIGVEVESDLSVEREDDSGRQTVHTTQVQTKLGKMHSQAREIYSEELSKTFLEDYALDALRLYAPVDGVEISCASKVWAPEKVFSDLNDALEANINSIKVKGNYYSDSDKYFIQDIEIDDAVNFVYSRDFPSRFEVWPVESGLMVAEPVGNQEGLGVLGFCYVPYHFVYDVFIPVLVQVYDSNEIFQFPIAVVIDKNKPRDALGGEALSKDVELCRYRNTEMQVYTYDSGLEPVEADISYKCFDSECAIGKTEINGDSALLEDNFPQCINGFIIARAPGYAEAKFQISTNTEGSADIILKKMYEVSVDIEIDGKPADAGVLYFRGAQTASVLWPQQKKVNLVEGEYNITLQVYKNSSLVFPAASQRKCIDVPKPGLLGFFGGTQEQCITIDMPSQTITNVLIGGGSNVDFFTEDRLENGKIKIIGASFKIPTSLEDLQANYEEFNSRRIYVSDE